MSSTWAPLLGSTTTEPDSIWNWADRGTPHVEFSKDEPLPFQEGEILGHGVNGPVVRTVIKGVHVALKRIYCRQKVGSKQLKEIEIIRKLRHPHIIELVSSYTRENYLEILLYPVATCDLATFLQDVDIVKRLENNPFYPSPELSSEWDGRSSSELDESMYRCAIISGFDVGKHELVTSLSGLAKAARARLWESYGCITSAMLYLHINSIRHRDLKPLNILLSRAGLWITDFGHSTDFTEFSDSGTTGGDRGTIKYCAPEVAAFERSGRSADVFSLGCIFFEMSALSSFTLNEIRRFRPLMDRSYHNNLPNIMSVFDDLGSSDLEYLKMALVKRMLSRNPGDRPNITSISHILELFQAFSPIEPDIFPPVWCTHLSPPSLPTIFSGLEEVVITIGNTCHGDLRDSVEIERNDHRKIATVPFVNCSSTAYIDTVLFFEHCSSNSLSVAVSEPPFEKQETIWGTFTRAVLVFLKPGYYWCSHLASHVPVDAYGSHRSVLPMTWPLQIDDVYASTEVRLPVYRGTISGHGVV